MQVKSEVRKNGNEWVKTANRILRQQHFFCRQVSLKMDKREKVIVKLMKEVFSLKKELSELRREMRVSSSSRKFMETEEEEEDD
jgi:hypothetical protein